MVIILFQLAYDLDASQAFLSVPDINELSGFTSRMRKIRETTTKIFRRLHIKRQRIISSRLLYEVIENDKSQLEASLCFQAV